MIKAVFLGTPQIAVNALEFLFNSDDIEVVGVVTQEDKPCGRGHKLTAPPIKRKAEDLGIRVFQTKSIRKDVDLINELKNLQPDFFVTFAFGQILSQEVLDIPKYATINMHASLLPKYRGANPIQRCLFNGDKETGITTMITVLALDAGDICLSEKIQITPEMTDKDLTEIISVKAPKLIKRTLIDMKNGQLQPQKQDEDKVTFADKFVKNDALINFYNSPEKIANQVRSMVSWPTAYTSFNEKLIKILKVKNNCDNSHNEAVGTVLSITKEGVIVAVNGGSVVIESVKPEGKGIMPARDWANGVRLKNGDKFGE